MAIIISIPLSYADTMWIVTGGTRYIGVLNMSFVFTEALITPDAVPIVALVAQGIFE